MEGRHADLVEMVWKSQEITNSIIERVHESVLLPSILECLLCPEKMCQMYSEAFLPASIYLISEGCSLKNGSIVLKMLVNKSLCLHAAGTAQRGGCSVSSQTLSNDWIKGGNGAEL